MTGIIIKAISGFFYVDSSDRVYECRARGVFKKNKLTPLVGDRVQFETDGDSGVVTEIFPRKNQLVRPPIANIDKLFIVSSFTMPAPNTLLIDRVISIAESKKIEPVIVFNKTDIGNFDRYRDIYNNAGFKTIVCSALTGEGISEILDCMRGSICAFTGNSGVGKSSIINAAFTDFEIETGDVSQKLGRGRHTTREVSLYKSGDYCFADTPGFSAFDLERCEKIYKDELPYTFREFEPYLLDCKFSPSCSHTSEKGCAIIEAVKNGEISESRYKSYCELYSQIKDIKDWEIKKQNNKNIL